MNNELCIATKTSNIYMITRKNKYQGGCNKPMYRYIAYRLQSYQPADVLKMCNDVVCLMSDGKLVHSWAAWREMEGFNGGRKRVMLENT